MKNPRYKVGDAIEVKTGYPKTSVVTVVKIITLDENETVYSSADSMYCYEIFQQNGLVEKWSGVSLEYFSHKIGNKMNKGIEMIKTLSSKTKGTTVKLEKETEFSLELELQSKNMSSIWDFFDKVETISSKHGLQVYKEFTTYNDLMCPRNESYQACIKVF